MNEALWLLRDFLDSGGWVLWTILFFTILLWTLMVERLWYLWVIFPKRSTSLEQRWLRRTDHASGAARHIRVAWLSMARQRLDRFMPMIRVLIALCPLLGLLGTVSVLNLE